ncbi:MAG: AAA family ATPase [Bacteroidota bacterium]
MSFQVGKPVMGNDLIGRDKEIHEIMNLLQSGQSVVLIAPRRFGKTSVLLEVLERMKKEVYTCYVDIFSVPTIKALAERITESMLENSKLSNIFYKFKNNVVELAKQLQLKQEFEGNEFILGFAQKGIDEWQLLEESLEYIENYGIKKGKNVLSAFDEFGDIKKLDGDQNIKLFRSVIQLQKKTTFLFSGSYESVMNQMFVNESAPFYRFARIMHLGYINKNDFSEYIKNTLHKEKIPFAENFINQLLDFTRGHPYYTQLFLQEYMLMSKIEENITNMPSIEEVKEKLLLVEKSYLEKFWETISSKKEDRLITTEIARDTSSIYSVLEKEINIARGIKRLVGKGVIYKEKNKYKLSDPLFELWMKENVLNI